MNKINLIIKIIKHDIKFKLIILPENPPFPVAPNPILSIIERPDCLLAERDKSIDPPNPILPPAPMPIEAEPPAKAPDADPEAPPKKYYLY